MKFTNKRVLPRLIPARRPLGAAVMVVALAGFGGGLAVLPAGAATVHTGKLALTPANATAGDTADVFTFTYTAPASPTAGTIGIDVPAGFSPPQDGNPAGPGYLSVSSACAGFQVNGVTADDNGGSVIAVAENCAAGLKGIVIYSVVTVPTTATAYPFATSFTPSGGSAVAFANQHSVTVKPGALASITVAPATAYVATGDAQIYAASGFDAYGNALGPVAHAKFAIAPTGSCAGATCTATALGPHTVTATSKKISGTSALTVTAGPDLAVTEQVSNTLPYYYSPVSFTTTVTNPSTTTASHGVSVSAVVPAALISPTVSASTGSYDGTSTWTVGTLAPGASATLTISGYAGDVDAGLQTLTATITSATQDPDLANNTASASEKSQPAQLGVTITPSPDNPENIDLSLPGDVSWTGSAYNAANPAAPAPVLGSDAVIEWYCGTASGNPCPDAAAIDSDDIPTLTWAISQFEPDTYTITFAAFAASDNYTGFPSTALTFTVSDSGA